MNEVVPTLASVGPPRLLAGLDKATRLDRVAHLTVHGTLPTPRADELVELAENINLRGKGGAGFPFAKKLQSVIDSAGRRGGRTAVVVNGSEGEPSCLKDTALLLHVPHLVLDGAVIAAAALGAEEVRIGVTRTDVERSVQAAIDERGPGIPRVQAIRLPERFVTGESTAMINGMNQGPTLPSGRKIRTSDSGLGGLPTLFSNTETFAQLAVAARLGALDYRTTGLPTEPGTTLLTVAGSRVIETPTGVPLPYILQLCGTDAGQGVLTGGYHGGWLSPEDAQTVVISRKSMEAAGTGFGAGAILPLPETTCPVGETIQVARWMAQETAGQCGPCVLGLPAIADMLQQAAQGGGQAALEAVRMRVNGVKKRGACSHPDGTARFIEGSLRAFAEHFTDHATGRPCGLPVTGALPVTMDAGTALALLPGPRSEPEPAEKEETPSKLIIDWTLCQGHVLCTDLVPELLQIGPDGYPDQAITPVPARLRQDALRAVRRCPALAMRLQE
jgi:NADH:ubiquinone oxidoreductase subunit F (NADH-binding)/ferredoxin